MPKGIPTSVEIIEQLPPKWATSLSASAACRLAGVSPGAPQPVMTASTPRSRSETAASSNPPALSRVTW